MRPKSMDDCLLGIDIGTTGTKVAIYNVSGKLLSMGQVEYGISIPASDCAEQDPEAWWRAVCDSVKQVLKEYPEGKECIKGVAVSSQAPSMIPLDREGSVLRPAMIWMDRRAGEETAYLSEKLGTSEIEKTTGNRPDPFYVAPKILWYKNHEPELFEKTSVFLQANGYINFKLTGEYSLDQAHASLLQLRDYRKNEWWEDMCRLGGVGPELFPKITAGTEIIGEITRKASAETGLTVGTPVMAGTVDSAAAALEAGVVEPGVVAEMTGTSTVLIIPNDGGIIEPAFIAMPHALSGLHLLLGALVSTGASLKWFRDELGHSESYDELTALAAKSRTGSGGLVFLPYMMGERSPIWNTNARGTFFGLALSSTKGDMVRAILEGCAFALKHNFEVAANTDITVTEIRSVGGGTRSPLWNQIKADVLGVPVLIPETSIGAPFGDALLAGIGLGYYPDLKGSLGDILTIRERYLPKPENRELYGALYQVYRNIYRNLQDEFDLLANIRND